MTGKIRYIFQNKQTIFHNIINLLRISVVYGLLQLVLKGDLSSCKQLCYHIVYHRRRPTRVLISHKYKFLYVRVPKSASSSISKTIQSIDPDVIIQLIELGDLYNLYPETKQYYLFSFIRNPLTRIESCWRDKIIASRQDILHYNGYIRKYCNLYPTISFENFCDWLCSVWGQDDFANNHWMSQSKILKLPFDFIGKFENLETDWIYVCNQIGMPYRKLYMINQSTYPKSNASIPQEILNKFYRRYKEDYNLGNYNTNENCS